VDPGLVTADHGRSRPHFRSGAQVVSLTAPTAGKKSHSSGGPPLKLYETRDNLDTHVVRADVQDLARLVASS